MYYAGKEGSGEGKKAMWLYPKVASSPPQRWGHSACFSDGLLYVFGGCCGGVHFSDVLVLNLATMAWTTLVTTGASPGPRDSHSATLWGDRMIVFGGTNGSKKVNGLHILDLGSSEWVQPVCYGTPPSPRESHTATVVGGDKLVVFGGSGEGVGNYLNDLHILDLKNMRWTSFTVVKGGFPSPRDSHVSVAFGHKLFVYGGDCGDRYLGDVDVFDINTSMWTRIEEVEGFSPGKRAGHAAVRIGTKVCVIGGVGEKKYYNDVWVLDTCTCSWARFETCGQQPQGRFSHTAVVADSDVIAIYGGCGEDERPLAELLVLQLGGVHPSGPYNISLCKKRRTTPTVNAKSWVRESEQEEHSLSLSQNSSQSQSQSQSDQEQTTITNPTPVPTVPLNVNSHPNKWTRQRNAPDVYILGEHHPINLMGAEVQGRVDGAFDSGYLMTATVNGTVFRGLLFAPLTGGQNIQKRGSNVSRNTCGQIQFGQSYSGRRPIVLPARNSSVGYERRPNLENMDRRLRDLSSTRDNGDLDQDLVLTLGGPGTGSGLGS